MRKINIKPYLVFECAVKGQMLKHHISTKIEAGFYIDNDGNLFSWRGMTWQILFSLEEFNLHKSGFIKLLLDSQIQFHSMNDDMLSTKLAFFESLSGCGSKQA